MVGLTGQALSGWFKGLTSGWVKIKRNRVSAKGKSEV
jgi:hypothetical protein